MLNVFDQGLRDWRVELWLKNDLLIDISLHYFPLYRKESLVPKGQMETQ